MHDSSQRPPLSRSTASRWSADQLCWMNRHEESATTKCSRCVELGAGEGLRGRSRLPRLPGRSTTASASSARIMRSATPRTRSERPLPYTPLPDKLLYHGYAPPRGSGDIPEHWPRRPCLPFVGHVKSRRHRLSEARAQTRSHLIRRRRAMLTVGYHDVKDKDHWLLRASVRSSWASRRDGHPDVRRSTELHESRLADGRPGYGRRHGCDGDGGGRRGDGARRRCPETLVMLVEA